MSKAGWAGWAVAAVAVTLLAIGIASGDGAEAEREARQEAERRAVEADSAAGALRDSLGAVRAARAREDSVHEAEMRQAQENARIAAAAASTRTERLRAQLTAEQQAELDNITAYWQEALAEEQRATASALERLKLAEADAADGWRLANEEALRANLWRDAYERAVDEVDALRRPDFFSLKLDDVPKMAAAVAVGYLAGR